MRRETCFWAPGLLLLANLARDPVPSFPFSLPGKCFKSDDNGALGFLNSVYGTEKPRSSVGRAAAAPRRPPQHVPGESSARSRAGKRSVQRGLGFRSLDWRAASPSLSWEKCGPWLRRTPWRGCVFLNSDGPLKRPASPGPKNRPAASRPSGPPGTTLGLGAPGALA